MENKEREQLIDRIRHMMEIQETSANAFQGEMANAAALAQKLMDKYGITLAEVELSGNKAMDAKFVNQPATVSIQGIESWHWALARSIGRITQTKHYSSSRYTEAKRAGVKHTHGKYWKRTGTTRDRQVYQTISF